MPILAINGGNKVRQKNFPAYNVIGKEEERAVMEVFASGTFSRFLGCWHEDFFGGPQVLALEKEWAGYFGAKHAIAVNSATSGLYCAVGAIGTEPGDEIIVSPYTMSASAVAPLVYGAIPVFADIEDEYFCLSPESIEKNITPHTKAIIVVDIFGLPYDVDKINNIAKKHGLKVIEDCSQAPGAKYKGKFAGTLGDVGIFSLNYHKHIHCGEGGIIVTNDDAIANKLRLIRNHAEAVLEAKGEVDLVNMIGFNYRMTEIEAAIARQQLKKLDSLVVERIKNIEYLTKNLAHIPFLEPAKIRENATHVFYVHSFRFNQSIAKIHRNKFVEAVKAELAPIELRETEGVKVGAGYVKPLYLQPLYQKRIAYGKSGYPWNKENYKGNVKYDKGTCPVAEEMYENALITHELMRPGMTKEDLDDVIKAFVKVAENVNEIS